MQAMQRSRPSLLLLTLVALSLNSLHTAEAGGTNENGVPFVQAWRRIALEPEYSGAWVVAGDLDGDRAVEIVSARNVDRDDVHFTSAVVAQRLDGTVLWRWGNPNIGRKQLYHDVACQIYDWDGDGRILRRRSEFGRRPERRLLAKIDLDFRFEFSKNEPSQSKTPAASCVGAGG